MFSIKPVALLIDHAVNSYIYTNYFIYPYIVSFIVGALLSTIFGIENNDPFIHGKTDTPSFILDPNNILNVVFANHVLFWYLAYFWLLVGLQIYMTPRVDDWGRDNNEEAEVFESLDLFPAKIIKVFSWNFARFTVIVASWTGLFGWFFGASITEKIATFTGINISGHSMVLSSASMSLLFEIKLFTKDLKKSFAETSFMYDNLVGLGNQETPLLKGFYLLLLGILSTVFVWFLLFSTTAVFFHTVLEKFIGLTASYVLIFIVYLAKH